MRVHIVGMWCVFSQLIYFYIQIEWKHIVNNDCDQIYITLKFYVSLVFSHYMFLVDEIFSCDEILTKCLKMSTENVCQ